MKQSTSEGQVSRRTALALLGVGVAGMTGVSLAADAFPARPITLFVPSSPGGSTDAICRALAESVSHRLNVPVIAENRPGAGGALATVALTGFKPDGYTVALMPQAVFNFALMQKTTFDPLRNVDYVIRLGGYSYGIVVAADSPYRTLMDVLNYARAHPGEVSYSHPGIGAGGHLAMEDVAAKAGVKLMPVPYKGSVDALSALLGKQVTMMVGVTEFAPQVDAGKLRALATMGSQRVKALPNVPTLREAGVDLVSESPFGIGAPRGTDPAVIKTLHDAFRAALQEPQVLAAFDRYMLPVLYMNSSDYEAYARQSVTAARETLGRLELLRAG
jgi:tripartite-type tricarboxylate transporter receptor subunit TctC